MFFNLSKQHVINNHYALRAHCVQSCKWDSSGGNWFCKRFNNLL